MLTLIVSGLSLLFQGSFSRIDGCDLINVHGNVLTVERIDPPVCAPLKTFPARYELTLDADGAGGASASGSLKLVHAGSNVLVLGKTARFAARATKRANFFAITFRAVNGGYKTVEFWDGGSAPRP